MISIPDFLLEDDFSVMPLADPPPCTCNGNCTGTCANQCQKCSGVCQPCSGSCQTCAGTCAGTDQTDCTNNGQRAYDHIGYSFSWDSDVYSGAPFNISAYEWNSLQDYIQSVYDTYSYSDWWTAKVSSGEPVRANNFNNVVEGINNHGNSHVTFKDPGDAITAEDFNNLAEWASMMLISPSYSSNTWNPKWDAKVDNTP